MRSLVTAVALLVATPALASSPAAKHGSCPDVPAPAPGAPYAELAAAERALVALLARLHVRRGGTAWGAYRLERVERMDQSLAGARALAAVGSSWVALGKHTLEAGPEVPRETLPRLPADARAVAIAASLGGEVAV